jgi:hypothetical protein
MGFSWLMGFSHIYSVLSASFYFFHNIVTILWCDYRRGLGLVVGFITHSYTQILTTSNYSAIANSHTLQFSAVPTKSSQFALASPVVAWWRITTMSSASVVTFLPAGDSPTTTDSQLKSTHPTPFTNCPAYNISSRTAQKTSFLCCCLRAAT